ncbi:MAG: hypothetical protein EBS90_12160, partial [Betaproteobacteria bacterium]|nr:hypothetical protein [Betaproteobacteria bacterium]
MNDDLAQMLKDTGKAVPVPGKPGRVYVFSKKKGVVVETSAKRAASWQAIGAAGRAARQTLSEAAEESYQSQAKENPMGRRREYDDSYFFEQYSQDPYGAQQAIPAARRNPEMDENPGRRRKKRQASPLAIAAFKRAQAIMKSKGCSIADALKQAWAEIPRTAKAAANPYFDSTQTRSALVPASFEWSDPTMTVTALEPMGRSNPDLTESDFWGGNARKKGAFAQRLGQFSPVQTSGFQPVNRRNPEGEVLYTSKGQPYVIEI